MEYNEFSDYFKSQATKLNIILDEKKIEQFYKYMKLLIEWNEKINLTAIVEPKEIIIKHFIDSITCMEYIKDGDKVIDVGTGAGFPGIPIAIMNNNIKLTLLDSLNKRIIFLQEVINQLGLKNIECIHGRAEDFAHDKKYREQYNIAISRAVAPLNILLEYLIPYTSKNGAVIAMKGNNVEEEIERSKNALKVLNASLDNSKKIILPNECGEHYILRIVKTENTDKIYPRKAGTPKKNPL